jgi:hypothetical protein
MAASTHDALTGLFRAVVGCVLAFVCIPAMSASEAVAEDQAYAKLALIVPDSRFSLDFHRRKSDGTVKLKFHDETESRSDDTVPWVSFGMRVWDQFWVGGDYLTFNGEGDGKIGQKVQLGPFSFFVNAPTKDTYKFDIGRAWVGYRVLQNTTGGLMVLGGTTVIQARAKAVIPGLLHESEEGILPLPMLGFRLSGNGSHLMRVLLEADYSYVNYNDIDGRATNISLSVDKALAKGFLLGLGYKYYEVKARVDRKNYDAQINQKLAGPYLSVTYAF